MSGVTTAQGVQAPPPPPAPEPTSGSGTAQESEREGAATPEIQGEQAAGGIQQEESNAGLGLALGGESGETNPVASEGDNGGESGARPEFSDTSTDDLSHLLKELSQPLLGDQSPESVNQVLEELGQNGLVMPISRIGITRPPHKLGSDD